MARYMIEVTHSDEHAACIRALRALESYGSHFVARAHWGCRDGAHSGWLVVDVMSRDDALLMIPPEFRSEARIVEVENFTGRQIAGWLADLEGSPARPA